MNKMRSFSIKRSRVSIGQKEIRNVRSTETRRNGEEKRKGKERKRKNGNENGRNRRKEKLERKE